MSALDAVTVNPAVGAPVRSRRQGARADLSAKVSVAVVAAVLLLLVIYPVSQILVRAASVDGLRTLGGIFTSAVNRKILLNTVVLGAIVGALGSLVGFCFAYAQARLQFRGKRLLHLLALMPIVSPPFAVATAIITLFGRSGIITKGLLNLETNVYGLPGLVIVLTLSFFPVAYMNLLGMLRSLDPALDEAASSLGASRAKIFLTVTLPMLVPGFAASFLLLFVETIADLANPLVIGGDYTVLSLRAYIAIIGEYDVPAGAAYSVVLLVPGLVVFLIQRYWVNRTSVVSVTGKPSGSVVMITSRAGRIPLLSVVVAIAGLIVLIYSTVVVGAFTNILGPYPRIVDTGCDYAASCSVAV